MPFYTLADAQRAIDRVQALVGKPNASRAAAVVAQLTDQMTAAGPYDATAFERIVMASAHYCWSPT